MAHFALDNGLDMPTAPVDAGMRPTGREQLADA
jgi:hypothetical protein